MDKEPITINGLEKIKEELIFLKEKKRPEIVAAISEARSHGDLKENAEYHAAKEEQSKIEGRILEINDLIARANVVDVTKLEKWFHKEIKKSCDKHNKNYYKKYKRWCDEYFYLPHRKESRGIGGIFFDYKKNNWEKDFSFIREVGITFTNIAREIILKKHKKKKLQKQKI